MLFSTFRITPRVHKALPSLTDTLDRYPYLTDGRNTVPFLSLEHDVLAGKFPDSFGS